MDVTSPDPPDPLMLEMYPAVPNPCTVLTNAAVLKYERLYNCEPSPINAAAVVLPVMVVGPSTYKLPPKI